MKPTAESSPPSGAVVLFDGDCGMCHRVVRFTLKHERGPELRFASLKSDYAGRALAGFGLSEPPPETVVVIDGDRILVRSGAALRIAASLRAPWRWLRILKCLPVPWRDALYDAVAHRRHRWFPAPESACPLSGKAASGRFLG